MNASTGLTISVVETVPDEVVDEFAEALREDGLAPAVERREVEAFASVVWLMASSVIVFIATKYFGAMAEEAGKDHYPAVKAALTRLTQRVGQLPTHWVVSGEEKLPDDPPGGLAIAIGPKVDEAIRFVFPPDAEQAESALGALLEMLEDDKKRDFMLSRCSEVVEGGLPRWRLVARYVGEPTGWVLWDPIGDKRWTLRGAP